MRYMKRTGIYKINNCTFDPTSIEVFSYSWWKFVAVIDGKVVFNNYSYSKSTTKHQWKVKRLMNELGIKIDIELPLDGGLFGTYTKYGHVLSYKTLEEHIVASEEELCLKFLEGRVMAQEKYQARKAKKDAEFKRNLDSVSYDDVLRHRAEKTEQFPVLKLVQS